MVLSLKTSDLQNEGKAPQAEGALKAVLEVVQKLQVKAGAAGSQDRVLKLVRGMQEAFESKLVGEKPFEEMSQEELLAMVMDPVNFTATERGLIQTLLREAGRVKKIISDSREMKVRKKSKKYRSSWVQG